MFDPLITNPNLENSNFKIKIKNYFEPNARALYSSTFLFYAIQLLTPPALLKARVFEYLKNLIFYIKKIRLPKISFLKNEGTDFPLVADKTNFEIKFNNSS